MKEEIDKRLKTHKRSITESFFSEKAMNGEKNVWVEGSTLRRFLSCDDGTVWKTLLEVLTDLY